MSGQWKPLRRVSLIRTDDGRIQLNFEFEDAADKRLLRLAERAGCSVDEMIHAIVSDGIERCPSIEAYDESDITSAKFSVERDLTADSLPDEKLEFSTP